MDNSNYFVDNSHEIVDNLALIVDKIAQNVDKCPFSVDKPVETSTFRYVLIRSSRSTGARETG